MTTKQEKLDRAEIIDAYRIFPRIFIGAYIILTLYSGWWIFHLAEITAIHTGLVLGILAVGAAWFNSYVKSGRTYGDK